MLMIRPSGAETKVNTPAGSATARAAADIYDQSIVHEIFC